MKKHRSKHHSPQLRPDALSLSQASVAVLLAFAATHAGAESLPAAGIAAQVDETAAPGNEQPAPNVMGAATAPVVPGAVTPMAVANGSAAQAGAFLDVPAGHAGQGGNAAPASAPAAAAAVPPAPGALAAPESVEFNSQFLAGSSAAAMDISRFDKGNAALPGHYRSALYVNGIWIGVTDVNLREAGDQQGNVQPVFDRDLLARAGVDLARLSGAALAKLDTSANGGAPALLPELIAQAKATFDMGEQRLDMSVPQAMMSHNARGWVDPKFWDDGVPAAQLQYNANLYHTDGSGISSTQAYLGLNVGVNAGPWRFRYNGNVTSDTGTGAHVQSMQTYLQRSLTSIKSQLTVGDSYTDGSVFDSFGVRGVQIGTDDRMYPESQRGYAPTVRGIASTNAKVEVKQNGNIIYETTVAPGPFEINDLYPTGYGGDLQVVVTEADGSQHVSVVPYSSPVNALRAGRWRYSMAAGQYRDASEPTHPLLFEASVQRGISNLLTLYGGTVLAQDYLSGAVGAALDTPVGAFAMDLTQANISLHDGPSRGGQSLRISYSRVFAPTDTDLTLAAYRYSTSGFLSLPDAMNLRALAMSGVADTNLGIQKGRLQLTLNQSIGSWGAIYASGYTQNYWNKPGRDTSFQVGYNTNIRRIGVGVSASRELDLGTTRWDNRFMLNLSIPLDIGSKTASTSTSYTHDTRDNSNQLQETFTGAAGTDNQFNYGVTTGYASGGGNGGSVNVNGGYLGPYTQMRANAGHANGYMQAGAGITGTIVGYSGGVALSSQTGDTLAVIEAKDAVGARVATAPGVRVDGDGLAVVAGMEPYSQNAVNIDTKGLPMGVEFKSTEQHFAPTAGAVVRVRFETENRGQAVVIRLRRPNGETVPFGADVLDPAGGNVGTVSQGSRAMFYSKAPTGDLVVKWGEGIGQSCKVRYELPVAQKGSQRPAATVFAAGNCE